MSLRDWLKQAKEWCVIALGLLVVAVVYLGGWATIGLFLFFQFGPWGIGTGVTLFLADVALLFFAPQWGFVLFVSLLQGSAIWVAWTKGDWWIALALTALVSVLVLFSRSWLMRMRSGSYQERMVLSDAMTKVEFDGTSAEEFLRSFKPLGQYAPDRLLYLLANGELEHRAPAKRERNPVDCTVFAPDRVEPKQTGLLQAFLHAPAARRQAEAAAKQFDPKATERGHRSLVLDAPFGTTFAFVVEIEGFVFPERTDTLLWTGQPQAATFRFDVPEECKLGQHVGTVRISQDGAPVGRITFQIEVVPEARGSIQQPAGKEARHYHACFCSYSSLDRAEMLKRAQGIRATGLETFIDVLTLRPGDMWNSKIFEAIDESDLFVVIWSTNARNSEWVKKESHYALRHYMERGSPDFVPIPVEGPPIASVPQDLQAYHFNDELLGQIRAAELEMLARNHLGQSNVTPVTSES